MRPDHVTLVASDRPTSRAKLLSTGRALAESYALPDSPTPNAAEKEEGLKRKRSPAPEQQHQHQRYPRPPALSSYTEEEALWDMLGQNLDKVWEMARSSQELWDTFQQRSGGGGSDTNWNAAVEGPCSAGEPSSSHPWQNWWAPQPLDENSMSVYLRYLTFSDNDLSPARQLSAEAGPTTNLFPPDQESQLKGSHDRLHSNGAPCYLSTWPESFNLWDRSQPLLSESVMPNGSLDGMGPNDPR
jgi:hypothetical protein